MIRSRSRLSSSILALIVPLIVVLSAARAAEPDPAALADLRRAYAAASLSTSEEPAVRAERRSREPSAGFMLGAALGAWTAAAQQLAFDLANPAGAGPPHVSQTGADAGAFAQDCAEEKTAFAHLDSRAAALSLSVAQTVAAAGVPQPMAAAWQARSKTGPAAVCR